MKIVIQFLCQIKRLLIFFILLSSCQGETGEMIQNVPELQLHDQPVIKGETKNGKREGKWTSFFPNGKIQSECFV